ncbi:MAG TPA: HAD family hydrolase [Gemmatimonadaceae bacterium]|nr:HAD family hydrolase [Gemmatimonadaceae bacterium]
MKLVLFDIDGTILWSDGAGRRAMTGALTELFGTAGPTDYQYDGKTDPQIVRELMRSAGHDDPSIDERMPELVRRYLVYLERELGGGRPAHLMEGVGALLDAVEEHPDVMLGLLTGNLRDGASLKLRSAGVDPSRFRVGAFGSDHHRRPELPAVAQRRARELGLDVRGRDMIVIGDTPDDIACVRPLGGRAIAVATGRFSVEQLEAHEPYAVFSTLADTDAVLRVILDA